MARRTIEIPEPRCTKRSDASTIIYPKVDALLKDLRMCSRRAAAATTAMQDELRILERLYYKGKNQHRSALFWRKVVEIRKFGQRLLEIDVRNFVDILRYSFYEDNSRNNPKIFKGTWTHIPDAQFIQILHRRTAELRVLADAARDRFQGAHHQFTLIMQTGAFLHLSLVLDAIVSRMDILTTEIQDILDLFSSSMGYFINTPKSSKDITSKAGIAKPSEHNAVNVSVSNTVVEFDQKCFDSSEDLGSVIQESLNRREEVLFTNSFVPNVTPISLDETSSLVLQQPNPTVQIVKPNAISTPPEGKRQKKKRRNAIDDIFDNL